MRTNRVWLEIVILGTAIAFGLALLFATLGAAADAAVGALPQALPANQSQSYQGMVTCSRCGAKHSAALDRSATTCVRECVHARIAVSASAMRFGIICRSVSNSAAWYKLCHPGFEFRDAPGTVFFMSDSW